jgi:hypothetical protein
MLGEDRSKPKVSNDVLSYMGYGLGENAEVTASS